MDEVSLKYIGDGFSKIGIPARDLTAEEVKEFGEEYLLATGLYAKPEAETTSKKTAKSGKE
jgi:hypothetical protein